MKQFDKIDFVKGFALGILLCITLSKISDCIIKIFLILNK